MTVSLSIENVTAHYGTTKVLEDLSLHIAEGELVSLLGSSGCGKTTTLRLVAGFLEPTAGKIRLGERDLTRLPAHNRDIGLVFQTYALFPHLTVRDNVAFGLKQRGVSAGERKRRADDMIDRVGLNALADRYPANLSGGQRQRVALARALVIEPPLLMFDEPLSNLDAKLRVDMRVEIRRLQQANGTTALYVTHDQEEAFSISDRVAIMNAGRIMQLDAPEVLYSRPANAFVADFVGFENMIPMKAIAESGDAVRAEMPGGATLNLPKDTFTVPSQNFILATRPEGLLVAPSGDGIPTSLGLRTYLGRAYQYQCDTAAGELKANGPLAHPYESGSNAVLIPQPEQCCLLPAEAA
ncbi:ABC transporter ATP-binding protein [Pseudooceanicola sediminis]|uniref:ABC transporter ATP-binding protein n=1 Tax=Pseudooceanicola sediminis TaxID=2211117 RepID=A0A399J2I4_9RHOB|nr:ABC transporter ATP-binding protein [Pseudooceanicola sediminis]KAA2317202.1 ABC transporter ATP-binding protein [Puniceibacterium sp. HSS470]RII39555.1 ABC transporter ATP-binding protein [Pseudooceanicola sediminis]|tara:strand:- start:23252 stop:24313 length:1062 start_codon:yes stop_codon:yes gene_type:complete